MTHEFLQSQVEVGTRVYRSIDKAGKELAHLRRTIAACAQEFGPPTPGELEPERAAGL